MVYQYTIPRKPVAAAQNSPGPIYALPSIFDKNKSNNNSHFTNSPSWKFGSKTNINPYITAGPGPCYSIDGKLLNTGMCNSQKHSIRGKINVPLSDVTPGPDLYFTEKSMNKISHQKSAPSFSILGKTKSANLNNNPGPNSYDIRSTIGKSIEGGKVSAPAYSIYSKRKIGGYGENLQNTPGPNNYAIPDSNIYMNKKPVYSLHGRPQMPSDSVLKPGPGAYNMEKIATTQKSAPSSSFGIKHSNYASGFILPVDIR